MAFVLGSRRAARFPELRDAGWLGERFVVRRWSLARLAGELGCTTRTAKRALRAHGISAGQRTPRVRSRRHSPRASLADRFWSRVDRRGPGECWLWLGQVHKRGYGRIALDGRRKAAAHVVAFRLSGGAVPDGYHVHHQCEEKLCCNPAHLEALSRGEHSRLHNLARAA